jgi:hypothetical protein
LRPLNITGAKEVSMQLCVCVCIRHSTWYLFFNFDRLNSVLVRRLSSSLCLFLNKRPSKRSNNGKRKPKGG